MRNECIETSTSADELGDHQLLGTGNGVLSGDDHLVGDFGLSYSHSNSVTRRKSVWKEAA